MRHNIVLFCALHPRPHSSYWEGISRLAVVGKVGTMDTEEQASDIPVHDRTQ